MDGKELAQKYLLTSLLAHNEIISSIDAAIAKAVAAEREACALEGDTIEAGFPPPRSYEQAHYLMGVQAMQAAIRARTTP